MQLGRTLARTILPLAFAAFVATGCGGDNGVLGIGGIPDDAICSVDGAAVDQSAFDQRMKDAKQQYKDNGRDFPKAGSDEEKTLKSGIVGFLIEREIVTAQADKLGLKVTDKDVDKGIADIKKQFFQNDKKKFEAELKRVGYTEERVRDDVEDQARSKKLYDEITKDVKVSDKEANDYYDDNQDQFVTKESRDVAHILVKTKPLADKIYAQVKGGDKATFAKLAKQYTQDPSSKETGGVLTGGIQRGQTVPEFDKVAFALKTGAVSPPVKTSFGFHVITARSAVRPEKKQSFDEVKDQIKKQLQGEQESERFQQWQKDVRKDAKKDVECRKGYVWTETVTTSTTGAGASTSSDTKKDDSKKDDAKKDDSKKDDSGDAGKKADGADGSAKTDTSGTQDNGSDAAAKK